MSEMRANRPLVEFAQLDFSFCCVSRVIVASQERSQGGSACISRTKNAGSVSDIFTNLALLLCVRTGAENHAKSSYFFLNTSSASGV
jgi:hypothetical protein